MTAALLLALGLAAAFGVDQLVGRRHSDRPVRWAATQFLAWSVLGLVVAGIVAVTAGGTTGVDFVTVLILEKTLSIDNVAVFATILATFAVAPVDRPTRVGQGVGLAIVLRTGLLLAGLAVVDQVHALLPVMGGVLLVVGVRILRSPGEHSTATRPARLQRLGAAGPLLAIGLADLVFAIDSVPAALAVTRNAYVVVGATGLAMVGLRPAYLLLEHGLQRLAYLPYGVAGVLIALGVELVIGPWVHVPDVVTLAVAVVILAGSCVLSLEGSMRLLEKIGKIVAGVALVVAGIVMLVIPGPGLLAIAAGLGLLATEIPWLQRRLHRLFVRLPAKVRRRTPKLITRVLEPAPGSAPAPEKKPEPEPVHSA